MTDKLSHRQWSHLSCIALNIKSLLILILCTRKRLSIQCPTNARQKFGKVYSIFYYYYWINIYTEMYTTYSSWWLWFYCTYWRLHCLSHHLRVCIHTHSFTHIHRGRDNKHLRFTHQEKHRVVQPIVQWCPDLSDTCNDI